jgi:hypothetical protein
MPIPDLDYLLRQSQYVGMSVSESEVSRQFLARHGGEFDRIAFNVGLGQGVEPAEHWTDDERAAARARTQKRVDFMLWKDNQPVVVEAKQRLTAKDLGQILTYRLLYNTEHPTEPPPVMLAVAYEGDPDVLLSLTSHGVTVQLYPRPTGAAI